MAGEFWLSEQQWTRLEPLVPTNQPGAPRKDDRRVISGIVHMLRNGGRWQDCPPCDGPPSTVYNRHHRWSGRGIWQGMLSAVVEATPGGLQLIDSTTAKAHRSAAGGKGGPTPRPIGRSRGGQGDAPQALDFLAALPTPALCLADAAYDSDGLRTLLVGRGTVPVIPNTPTRKRCHPFDKHAYKQRDIIERAIGKLKDWRRIHTPYDKLARNYASAVALPAILQGWC